MPVFFSIHSDLLLSAMSIAMLMAGVICISISREKTIARPIPSWRYLGISLIILAIREWFGIIGLSTPGFSSFYAIAAVTQALASIPLLMAARVESPDQRNRVRVIRILAALTLAVMLGTLLEPFVFYQVYLESGRSFITSTLFFLVKFFFCLTALLLTYCTIKGESAPSRHMTSILILFSVYCFIMSICPPPGVPTSALHQLSAAQYGVILLYAVRLTAGFALAIMLWNIYARVIGVVNRIRWWPLLFMFFIVMVGFLFVYSSQISYRRVVAGNILASAKNAAISIPGQTLLEAAETPGSANVPKLANRLFGRARNLNFVTGYNPARVDVDALVVNPETGAITPIIDIMSHPSGGLWALGSSPVATLWSEMLYKGAFVRGLHDSKLSPVIAIAPVTGSDGGVQGAAVLTVSAIDLVQDLYRYNRPLLLIMPAALFILLMLLGEQQRAWLAVHSSNRAEAMRLGLLSSDLSGILVTQGGAVVDANQRFLDVTGAKRGELLGADVSDLFHLPEQGLNAEALESFLSKEDSSQFEASLIKANGDTAHVMVHARKLSPSPEDSHIMWECVDVTQIKDMENEIRGARDYLQTIVDSLPVGVFAKDAEGRYRLANQAFVEVMNQTSSDQVIGSTAAELGFADWETAAAQDEVCVDMRGATLTYEQTLPRNGETRYYEIAKSLKWLGDDGDKYVIVGCMHDFTIRKRIENAIEAERHFLMQLINTMPITVCFIDRDRVIRICDLDFCREAGVDDPSELVGRLYDDVSPFGDPNTAEDIRMLEKGSGYSDTEYELLKNGRRRNFMVRRIVMSSADGTVMGLIKAFWDTTALVAANKAAKNADRAKAAFLTNMSHELRTPMNGIVGMADLITEHESTEPVQRIYAETIIKSAKTLQMVIDEVVDIATLDSLDKRFTVARAPFPLLTLTEEATEIVSCIVGAWGGEVRLSYDFNLDSVYIGDARRLRQVLVQVLTHCSRLTVDKRLQLRVGAREGGDGDIVFNCRFYPAENTSAAHLESMFKQHSTTPEYDAESDKYSTNLGIFNDRIGLPLAWRLIQAMGGGLAITNRGGAIDCRVTLPFRSATAEPTPTVAPALKGMRAVIALSDGDIASDVLSCMRYAGAVPDIVADPESLYTRLREAKGMNKPYDLLLLDLGFFQTGNLPEFIDETRDNPDLGAPDIALLVGPRDVQDLPGMNGNKADCLLLLPLCPSELWFKIERLWELRGHASPGRSPANARRPVRLARTVQVPANVLLVEDNTVNQMVEMGILKKIGCHPTLAKNGAEAVEIITSGQTFDLVLMDCMIPIMDGYEATSRIRLYEKSHSEARRNTIVALTANTVQGDREKCLAAGMDDYVAKPITLEAMREILFKHCPGLITMIDQAEVS